MAKALRTQEIREEFVRFFTEREHRHVSSSPIVPIDDPTLLFTSAGMVQFKRMFAGAGRQLEYTRATSVQKCFRASDLERVGHTPRHLTFFEMLGNFSFGDYFKKEAILWAWEFVIDVLGMDRDALWVTVYTDDDEAARLWEREVGVAPDRIVRLGDEDNFWGPAGSTGACGPSSEIYMDLGEAIGCGRPECRPGCECDRFQEFWNLVFPQFDQQEDGTRQPLARPGIDTGLGLERLAQLLQGVDSVFEIDEFRPLREAVLEQATLDLTREEHRVALNVIMEHARAVTMLFHEGVYPSNEGRGYVARRILRRASRRGHLVGLTEPFLHRLTGVVIDVLGVPYPDLRESRERIARVCEAEESRFHQTLENGMSRFEEVLTRPRDGGGSMISGPDVFLLYDTFGFPPDLTAEMAAERGLQVDLDGFRAAMQNQVQRSRETARFDNEDQNDAPWTWTGSTEESETRYVGYDALDVPVRVVARRPRGEEWEFLLDTTPFYAEGGGQVGDHGWLLGDGFRMEVIDVRKQDDHHVHRGRVVEGAFDGAEYRARVDQTLRRNTERNHTATHLLHAALKRVVGSHVTQAGSLVAPDRLRFDFNHFHSLTEEEIQKVEDDVNAAILADLPVVKEVTSMEEARRAGAVAMFGEKYGDTVRQVFVPGEDTEVTRELCGGCHVRRTGEIGVVRIVSEESVAAGVRRLEAVTGWNALRHARDEDAALRRIQGVVKAGSLPDMESRVRGVLEENERLKREVSRVRAQMVSQSSGDLLDRIVEVDGVRFLATEFPADDVKGLRDAADKIRDRMASGVGLLAGHSEGKVALLAFVTDDLIAGRGLRADHLVKEVAKIVDGGGGGRPQLATAGGKSPERIPDALRRGREILEKMLAGEPAES